MVFRSRFHLFEFHDMEFTPKWFHGLITDMLTFLWMFELPFLNLRSAGIPFYSVCTYRLAKALKKTGATTIIDLCSGAGGPLVAIRKELAASGLNVSITLTDLVPHVEKYEQIRKENNGTVDFSRESVDATNCKLKGFRTIFASFHHFKPDLAKKIIQNAIDTKSGIAIFEATERSAFNIFFFFPWLVYVVAYVCGCFIKPRSFLRFFFTIILPWVPFVTAFDGLISSLRTYSPDEMRELISTLRNAHEYEWEIGVDKYWLAPNCVFYIGVPKTRTA